MVLHQDTVLQDLEQRTREQLDYLKKLESFSAEVLNHKPDEKSWSALECLEHLNILGAIYLKGFRQKTKDGTPRQDDTYKTGWLGQYAARIIRPKEDGSLPYKMKALPFMTASASELDKEAVLRIQKEQLEAFLDIIGAAHQVDLGKNRVATSLGSWLKFKLGDAMRFYFNHQERHYVQMERTINQV
jgi:integrase